MSMLKRVIGMVLAIIRPAGRVAQTVDSQTGGERNIAKGLVRRAKQESKAKQSAVKQDTRDLLPKIEISPVPTHTKKSQEVGTPQVAPAPQPAKSKSKPKRSVAQPTTQGKSRSKGKQAVRPASGGVGKQPKTPASKTRQHAK